LTVPAWLSFAFELGTVIAALVGVFKITDYTYTTGRRLWYRFRARREFTRGDRVSLDALTRMERKP